MIFTNITLALQKINIEKEKNNYGSPVKNVLGLTGIPKMLIWK